MRKMGPRSRRPAGLVLALAAVAAVLWLPAPVGAQSPDLFFSEYVEGTNTNRALEIYNGTGAHVTLSGNYAVQIYRDGSMSPTTIHLIGGVAPGDVFVLASSFAHPDIVAQADQLVSALPFSGNDAVVLRSGVFVADSIGQVGHNPGTEWGSGLVSTMDNTLRRQGWVEAGDTNPFDEFDPAVEWDGYPVDTFDGLGWHHLGSHCESNPPSLWAVLSPDVLWPPNHELVPVEALVVAVDDTDPAPQVTLESVTSSEPDDALGMGDGSTVDDVVVVDEDSFELRAERAGKGTGRVYTATYRATDACGNWTEASATAVVPLHRGA